MIKKIDFRYFQDSLLHISRVAFFDHSSQERNFELIFLLGSNWVEIEVNISNILLTCFCCFVIHPLVFDKLQLT